jgi:hypothetical protein
VRKALTAGGGVTAEQQQLSGPDSCKPSTIRTLFPSKKQNAPPVASGTMIGASCAPGKI